ncbi:MAG: hypothetical protein DMG07_22040 [Acidobacteria bacterium]|nr:MAG: hypothetical protein DMG07_22040 [Acidobacteriota bacterium]
MISHGQGMGRMLLVNGVGITSLTPVTKTMAHLPLASLPRAPDSALVICFGMGTTFRSALSWGISVKAVELVPSVKEAFGYFFDDAQSVLANKRGRIVIDDGRRFLKRTSETFDVITVDPPPPVEAAGSSLLYSEQFYQLVRTRLRDDGILQQWFPGGEDKILHAVAGSLVRSFPHVRVFRSSEDWGYHFLASKNPIHLPGVDEMLARMPEAAQRDLLEWSRGADIHDVVKKILNREVGLPTVSDPHGGLSISDDRPFNEYYVLRRQLAYRNKTFRIAH